VKRGLAKTDRVQPGRDYATVRAAAQRKANETGFDHGVERDAFGFRSFMLPRRENRYGHETRCEVVSCEQLGRCQEGHGPR